MYMAGERTVFISIVVTSIAISAILQWLADSGERPDLSRLVLKVASGVVAYSLAFILLRRQFGPEWKLLILIAFIGTLINSALSTVTDASNSYMHEYLSTISGFSEWSGLWLTTLVGRVVLSPVFTVLFLIILFPVYGVMLLVGRFSRRSSNMA